MDKFHIASRIAGLTAAGLVLYNANNAGVKGSAENIKIGTSERLTDEYMKSRRMEDRSMVTSKLKDSLFRDNADWNLPDKINGVGGYFASAFTQAAYDVVPAVLATGALVSKKYAKFFGAGLGIYAIKYLLCDVMDFGRINHLKSND